MKRVPGVGGRRTAAQVVFAASALTLAAAFCVLVYARSREPLALDQGLFACFGAWPGLLPYRDLFDSKPPLFLYGWSVFWRLGGADTAGMWRVEVAWLTASMLFAAALAARLWGRVAALAAAAGLLYGLWSPNFGAWWSRAQAEELLVVPMLGSAWLALRAVERPRLAFAAGLLAGVCGLFKIPALAIAGAWVLFWLATAGFGASMTRSAWLSGGVAIPWLIAATWFRAHDALGEFYEGVFQYHRYNVAYLAAHAPTVARFTRTYGEAIGSLLLLAAIGIGVCSQRDRRLAWWLGSWSIATLAAVLMQRQLAGYHFLLAVPSLALAAAVGSDALIENVGSGRGPARLASGAALLVAASLGAREFAGWQTAYGPGMAYRRGSTTRAQYLQTFGIALPANEEAVAEYLRAATGDHDGILIWGLSPGIYALSKRRPVTRYPFHKILMTEAPLSMMIPGLAERRAEFMRRLEHDPPAYIALGHDDSNDFEPQDSVAAMLVFEPFHRFVERRYREETRIGGFGLFRRLY